MSASEPTDETYLAVSIGELKTGMKTALAGIDGINTKLDNQDNRLRDVETKHEVLAGVVGGIKETMKTTDARRTPWTAIVALVFAGASVAAQFFQF